MINEKIKSAFNDSKLMNKATINVSVEMNPSQLLDKMAEEINKDIMRLTNFVGSADYMVGTEDILKYLKTLVFLRVAFVNNELHDMLKNYRSLAKHLGVPVLMYQCLISMGVAYDRDFAIRFNPTYSIDDSDLLSPEEMESISDIFTRLENVGMKIVIGIPRDEAGELDFMALSHVAGEVVGYRRSHPVYGFLASFFAQKQLSEVTGLMCRVLYGYQTDYSLYVSKLYSALTK